LFGLTNLRFACELSALAGAAAMTDKPVANKMAAVAIEINFLNMM
jgi:hypothetical protein